MYRVWLIVVLLTCAAFPAHAHAQAITWTSSSWPKTSKTAGYVTVQGKVDLNKVNMKFVTVFACVNGGYEGIKSKELSVDQTTGVWGDATNGTDIAGPAGEYKNGDTLQVFVYGIDTNNNKKYWLTGAAASGK
ncbi:MAG: hypothetical protein HYR84_05625 [Planctomycetes bacterium]|nr:hypothetical protein [Planctomycetota bacterium]